MRRASHNGFTLVEMMLAVTLLGLLVTVVSMTWHQGLNGWKRSSAMTEVFQRERVVLGTIAELTQSIVFYRSRGGIYDIVTAEDTEKPSISFVTGSDAMLPPTIGSLGGLRRVTLALLKDENGRPYLGIRNEPALAVEDPGTETPFDVLSADVTGLSIRYRNPRTQAWEEKWEQKALLPAAIEYTITFGGADERTTAVTAIRQVDLPTAAYTMSTGGAAPGETTRGGRVLRRDVPPERPPGPMPGGQVGIQ
jgi:prepilin-type N-terminal cleavage/methylation domain-containing protein